MSISIRAHNCVLDIVSTRTRIWVIAVRPLNVGCFPYEFQSSEAKFVVKLNKNVDSIAGITTSTTKSSSSTGLFITRTCGQVKRPAPSR